MNKKVIIDSNIFIEAWTEQNNNEFCEKTIRKHMNNQTKSYIPIIVPGEVLYGILKETKDKERITTILKEYKNRFLDKNINFIFIDNKVIKIKKDLDEIYNIDEHDKFIVACAIKEKCSEIITLDEIMYNEQNKIRKISHNHKNYKISIIKPNS